MPVMDGLVATETLRARGYTAERLPVIGLTASLMQTNLTTYLQHGMNNCLGGWVCGCACARTRCMRVGVRARIHVACLCWCVRARGYTAERLPVIGLMASLMQTNLTAYLQHGMNNCLGAWLGVGACASV